MRRLFIIAALLAALSGWLYAHLQRVVNPTPFSVVMGIEYLFMIVLGGVASLWGALLGAALLTLSYLGAERAIPNYNVMGLAKASLEANVRYMANAMGPEGVRVNAISAGPIRTLAASGIKDFRKMLAHCEAVTPIRRTVTIEDVGNSAAFLCSDLSAGISGEVVHVDGGFNIAAMNELEIK